MNLGVLLFLVGLSLASRPFGSVASTKPQITQGYYKPTYHPKLKMNSTALFDIYKKGATDSIEPGTYYLAMTNGQKQVFEKMPGGWSQSRELYIPEHYTLA